MPPLTEIQKAVIASMARWMVAFLIGAFGIKWSDQQVGETATAVGVVMTLILTVTWSWADKKKLLNTPPPNAAPPQKDPSPCPPSDVSP